MDLQFVPGPGVDLLCVAPVGPLGPLPEHSRVVDAATARAIAELAVGVRSVRSEREAARRLEVLVVEARHRMTCVAADPDRPRR